MVEGCTPLRDCVCSSMPGECTLWAHARPEWALGHMGGCAHLEPSCLQSRQVAARVPRYVHWTAERTSSRDSPVTPVSAAS